MAVIYDERLAKETGNEWFSRQDLQTALDMVYEEIVKTYRIKKPSLDLVKGKCAGRAHLGRWIVGLNPICRSFEDLIDTVYHELSHFAAYRFFGDTGHGKDWKHVMRTLGRVPERCHRMNLPAARSSRKQVVLKAVLECQCLENNLHVVSGKRAAYPERYKCRACNSDLKVLERYEENP